MTDFQNATITIDSIESKDNRFKIKSTQGGTYSFFMMKKDGSESNAYQQMQNMQLKKGDTVDIAYTTSPNEKYPEYPYKNIANFREASVGQQAIQVEPKVVKEETDWDKISWGKCKHAFLVEYLKKGVELADAEPLAEEWADASMRKLEKPATTDESDISSMDIPF